MPHITGISNERGDIMTDHQEIRKIIWDHDEEVYAKKLTYLDKTNS